LDKSHAQDNPEIPAPTTAIFIDCSYHAGEIKT